MITAPGAGGAAAAPPLELWGGIECTVNRVGDRYHDQLDLTGHAGRSADLERVAALGVRRLRYPVLWERVAPDDPLRPDWRWVDSRLAGLRSLGIAPIAGLVHHGSGPAYSTLLDSDFPVRLAAYAGSVAERFPWIDAYTPINEPLTTARFCALYGHWYPHGRSDATFVRALLNQCRATVLAMRAVREVNPSAQLVQTDDAGKTFSTLPLAYQARFENHRRWLAWDLLFGRVDRMHPMRAYLESAGASSHELGWLLDNPCPPDIVGLNYYLTSDRFLDEQIGLYDGVAAGGNGRDTYVDVEAVRACRAISGHRAILAEAWQRYGQPVAFTEVHLGSTRDEQMRWILEAWDSAHSARRAGVEVRAVTAWALFGLTDWDSLVTDLKGHYEPGAFDVRGPEPRATALAGLLEDLAAGRDLTQPVFNSPGWWRRRGRLWVVPQGDTYPVGFPPKTSSMRYAARAPRRPILITGGGGTLATAFARLCTARGLAVEVSTRAELDITAAGTISEALDRHRPWAVVNAAGYVRVDDAEADENRCREVNTIGATHLAEACRRRGIRLLCFSSDLVFDGASARPYLESDAAAPLSVYGRSKADAERTVRTACPQALIARTSAFFGPWDAANFVYHAAAAFAAGRTWRAPSDQRVSPTYVPDLVNVSLDLLIDGADGIWHLANDGDVSWSELARKAAAALGYPEAMVDECETAALRLPAVRPGYSVLGTERGQRLPPLDDALSRFFHERERTGTRRAAHAAIEQPTRPMDEVGGPCRDTAA
jgi:dTDP-4-dehydrorhamnose reductase